MKTSTMSNINSDIAIMYQSSITIAKSIIFNFLKEFNFLLSKTNPKSVIELLQVEEYYVWYFRCNN